EKETEGVAPVFARHSAPQFPLPPYTARETGPVLLSVDGGDLRGTERSFDRSCRSGPAGLLLLEIKGPSRAVCICRSRSQSYNDRSPGARSDVFPRSSACRTPMDRLSQIDTPCGPGCPSSSAAIAVSFVAACVLFGFFDGFQSLVRLAAFIQCGKHQIRIHRLLKRCRLGIMAV